jgi:hypothetical protein
MKKIQSIVLILGISIALSSCKKIEAIESPAEVVARNESTQNGTNVEEEKRILVFEDRFGSYENQIAVYKFTFKGNKVQISYQYAGNEPMLMNAELENGKIVQKGCSDCYIINQNELCEPNPETGDYDCYSFNQAKSTHSIDEVLYPSKKNIKNSSQKSFAEIRSLVISGNKDNMIRHLGKPNEDLSSYDFLKKYYNWKPISIYSSKRPLGLNIYMYDNIDNTSNTILVIYNLNNRKVTEIMYKSDVESYEDICVH